MKRVNEIINLNKNKPKRHFKSRSGVGQRPIKISDVRKAKQNDQ